jgi:DNA-directed RNA polymerase subunit RPC12/RpoP
MGMNDKAIPRGVLIAENIRLESENKYLKADNANIREEMDKSKSENASWKKGYEQEHELAKTALEKTIVVMKENAELKKDLEELRRSICYLSLMKQEMVIEEWEARWEKLQDKIEERREQLKGVIDSQIKRYPGEKSAWLEEVDKLKELDDLVKEMQELESIGNDSKSPDNTKSYCKDITIPAAKLGVANDKRDKGLGPPKLSQPLPPKPEMRIYVCPICNEEFDLKDLSHGFGVCKKCKNTVHANPKPDAKYKRIPSHYRNGKKIRGYLVKIKPKPDDVHYARGRTIKKHKTFWDKKPSAKGGK